MKLPPQPGRVVVRPALQLGLVLGLEDRVAVPDLAELVVGLRPNEGPFVVHVATAVTTGAHDLDSRSEGCDGKGSGDVLKAGRAELLKVVLHQRPRYRVRRPQFAPQRPTYSNAPTPDSHIAGRRIFTDRKLPHGLPLASFSACS